MNKVAVVIPFFQRQPGILKRALDSIFQQRSVAAPDVVVVDDSSPSPADVDLVGLDEARRAQVRVIHQANGGPGAARNAALDHLPPNVDYVAFLDSDDQWDPDHLNNGLQSLNQGKDVYFTNYSDIGDDLDGFSRRGELPARYSEPLHPSSGSLAYTGEMRRQILEANFIQLSTVIYRHGAAPGLRFRPQYRRAGEDLLFLLELACATNRFCYTKRVEVLYGKGVNVYRSATLGTAGAFERVRDETTFRRTVLHEFARTADDRRHALRALGVVRKQFAAEVLHRLRRRHAIGFDAMSRQWHIDPMSIMLLPANIGACAIEWLRPKSRA